MCFIRKSKQTVNSPKISRPHHFHVVFRFTIFISLFIFAAHAWEFSLLVEISQYWKNSVLTLLTHQLILCAVLLQHIAGVWTSICFFSPLVNYAAFDKELLAMYLAVNKVRNANDGRPFTLFTNHKPLTFAFSSCIR